MTATVIHFVRHGLVHNPRQLVYGRLPRFRLDPMGITQAQAAGLALSDKPLVAIYASPLLRARQTAREIQAHHPQLKVKLAPLIIEVGAPHDGKLISEMEAVHWDLYTGNTHPHEQPEGITTRARQFFIQMRKLHPGKQVAAVTHGDVLAFTIMWAMGETPDWRHKGEMKRFGFTDNYPQTASITTLTFHSDDEDERPEVKYLRPY